MVNLKLLPLSWEMRGEKNIEKQYLLVKLRDCYQSPRRGQEPQRDRMTVGFVIRGVDFEW